MKLTIKSQLVLLNVAATLCIAVVALIGYLAITKLDQAMDDISGNGSAIKDQMAADQTHDALRADVIAALLAGSQNDTAQRDEIRHDLAEHLALFRKLISSMEQRTANPEIRSAMARVRPDSEAYLKSAADQVALAFTDAAAAQQAQPEFMKRFRVLEKSMGELSDLIEKQSEATRAGGDAIVVQSKGRVLFVSLIAALLCAIGSVVLVRSITRPLDEAVTFADLIAEGRLDAALEVDEKDRTETGRLKRALQAMRTSLHKIVGEVRGGTESMVTASREIADGNMDLSRRTEMQAGALEETASSMEELTATVRQNADHARQANQMAISASEVAVKGGAVVSQVVQTMGTIDQASRKIAEITGVIEGIAFQTNILALNAAVEAARAGEQGRGFAVVASEVRNLAQRSNSAAKDIKQLIAASVEQVGVGSRLVSEAGSTMQEVVASVNRMTDIMGEITAASREQEDGIAQVNKAVVEIDATTQQNAALVEQAAAAASSLRTQADTLRSLVSAFRLHAQEGGHQGASAGALPDRSRAALALR
jgi:methyl-accepting chemotaxis protein